ncbi:MULTISPECIES: MFS transporter [unclassified Colwellia]|jgi:PPP family 3-phenylpropionic acid transporter|uniref:MFS transporter n=1 Tax=unclassified Colwellia TaxID=196834 RepID=UPI0015F6F9FA|nr:MULTISPECIES: MFS transporter [unclassified Colwellia]MBA6348850.1 MFS transporter [Colwellia sp. BRX8-9]MBA6352160.1 MFS transporter [Colwellia sp. BRX9-1]MBA6379577.1 MFS transporter [Colwellia sp. BRX10-7]MBA6386174.1 MFS transporter [Colwellia sp. BRX10-2]MBA6403116.1 MFS transporter [Colwellia sp. BRX10-5]
MTSVKFVRLSSSYFWYFAILGLIIPFLPVFLDAKSFSSIEIGEILAIITATKIIGPTFWAFAADKSGKQLTIIRSGALLALLSFSLLFWLNGYWPVVFCLAIFSLFWTAVLPQLEVLTLNSIRRSAKIYARIRLWGSIGFIFLAVIAGDLIERYSADAFTYLGVIVLAGLFLSSMKLHPAKKTKNPVQQIEKISDKIFSRSFIFFFLAGLMLQMSFGPYYGFFALYLRELAYPGFAVGIFITISVLAEILIFIYASIFFRYFRLKTLLAISILLTSLRWFMTGSFADVIWVLVLVQCIHALSFGLYHSVSIQFIHQHFNHDQQNRGQAIYIGGVYGLGGAIGAYIAGIVWQGGQGSELAYNLAASAAFIGFVLVLFMQDRQQVNVSG